METVFGLHAMCIALLAVMTVAVGLSRRNDPPMNVLFSALVAALGVELLSCAALDYERFGPVEKLHAFRVLTMAFTALAVFVMLYAWTVWRAQTGRVSVDHIDRGALAPLGGGAVLGGHAALTLQPLVENAIHHGVRFMPEGMVIVSTERRGSTIRVTVEDNGPGFPKEMPEQPETAKPETPETVETKPQRSVPKSMRTLGSSLLGTAPTGFDEESETFSTVTVSAVLNGSFEGERVRVSYDRCTTGGIVINKANDEDWGTKGTLTVEATDGQRYHYQG